MPDSKKYNVLIVEDDDSNYLYISIVFESENIKVTRAQNGYKAIELVKNAKIPYDLILMDIKLPGIDGFETTKQIRQIYPKLPIIAQTAYYVQNDTDVIHNYGFNGIIFKPFQITELLNRVYSVLEKESTSKKTIQNV